MDANLFRLDPSFTAVAIGGGPCGGKSSFLARARQWLENHGLKVAVMLEVATELITDGLSPADKWRHGSSFQEHLLLYSIERENRYYRMMQDLGTNQPRVLLCDRGLLDGIAYTGRDAYLAVLERAHLDLHDLRERYRAVVHLITAADGAEEYYTLTNNTARSETPAEARRLDVLTQQAWLGHQHLFIIDNSTGFEAKMQRALSSLARILNMPEPKEIERKFLIHNFHLSMIPADAVAVEIKQDYLTSTGNLERRVRSRTLDGSSSYYYTEKVPTIEIEERIEREREISRREYEDLLRECDPALEQIQKTRYCFGYAGHHLELDVYNQPVTGLAVLEIELRDRGESITLPEEWQLEEVTQDSRYKNQAIAAGSLR